MYDEKEQPAPGMPTPTPDRLPDRGPSTDPNPGERSALDQARNVQLDSLGIMPARGTRAGGGQQMDVGAMVGVMRNLEFTAGGRAHRLSTGTTSSSRPAYDPRTGRLHTSAATDTNDSSLGSQSGQNQPAMPTSVEGAGKKNDTSSGDVGPERRRDKDTP